MEMGSKAKTYQTIYQDLYSLRKIGSNFFVEHHDAMEKGLVGQKDFKFEHIIA